MNIDIRTKHTNPWQDTFGLARESILATLVGSGWIGDMAAAAPASFPDGVYLTILEENYFGLKFKATSYPLPPDMSGHSALDFSLYYNYDLEPGEPNRRHVRLKNVFIGDFVQGRGFGSRLLKQVSESVIQMGADTLFVFPENMGSYFWPRAGAIPLHWADEIIHQPRLSPVPGKSFFQHRIEPLIYHPDLHCPDWSRKDRAWLCALYKEKNPRGLGEIAASNLYVKRYDDSRQRLDQYVLHGLSLGPTQFDYRDPWTQKRLMETTGFVSPLSPHRPQAQKTGVISEAGSASSTHRAAPAPL